MTAAAADLSAWAKRNAAPMSIAFVIALVVYSTFWTDLVFTNHTIPNSSIYRYPSFKTVTEGRWFADIIIWLFGGGGTQSFQTIAGIAIQAINGVVFAELFQVRQQSRRIIIALLIALHPAVLDYFSFTIDSITFTFGDTLALIGLLLLSKALSWRGMSVGVLALVLALAAYQPKLSLIATLGLCVIAAAAADPSRNTRAIIERAGRVIIGPTIALFLYWLTALATVRFNGTSRNNVSDFHEVASMTMQAYPTVTKSLFGQFLAMPSVGSIGLALLVICALGFALFAAARKSLAAVAIFVGALALLPPAIEATRIINSETGPDIARTLMGYAYLAPFLLTLWPVTKLFAGELFAAMTAFGFGIIATQENEFTSMKGTFDIQMMSRVAGRIEEILPDRVPRPLVVIGEAAFSYGNRMVHRPDRPLRPHSSSTAFIQYRQGQMANFFLGRDILTLPTQADVDKAIAAVTSRPIWPVQGSVFLLDGIVVVALEEMQPGVKVTLQKP